MTRRVMRCPRCGAPCFVALDVVDGEATCGSCGLTWPYITPDEEAS